MAAKLQINLLVILTFLLIGLYFARAVQPTTDTYWHLSIGRLIVQTKHIPNADPFIYGPKDNHFTSTEWLTALILYAVVKYFGFAGLIILRVLLGVSTIYFLYLTIRLLTKSQLVNLTACLITAYAMAIRLFDRPENFSFLFLAITNYSCLYYYFKKKLSFTFYLLPFIFLIWPNTHPLAAFGLAILAVFTTIALIRDRSDSQAKPSLYALLAIFALSTIVSLIQFKRFFYFLYANQVASFEITEFMSLPQRLWITHGYDFLNQISGHIYIYFGILLSYIMITIASLPKIKQHKTNLLLTIFYFLLLLSPIKLARLIPVVLLTTLPWFAYLIGMTINQNLLAKAQIPIKVFYVFLLTLLLISIISGHIVGQRENASLINLSSQGNNQGQLAGVVNLFWKAPFPYKSESIIGKYLESNNLYTSNFASSYYVWYLPQIRVFSDVMHEYRTRQDFEWEGILNTGGGDWQELIEKYDIDTVVNGQFFVFYTNNTPVYTLRNWKLVYLDDTAIIYARDDVIKSQPLDLSAIHPELERGLKYKPEDEKVAINQLQKLLEFDTKNGFARQQLVIYWMDHDLTKAKMLAEQSRILLPNDPISSLQLAIIYARSNDCSRARQFADEAKRKSFNHPIIKNEVHRTVGNCLRQATT